MRRTVELGRDEDSRRVVPDPSADAAVQREALEAGAGTSTERAMAAVEPGRAGRRCRR